MLEGLAGIRSRRWWPETVSFADAAAKAGRLALDNSGVNPSDIGLLIDTSVCRDHLEPSAAVDVHLQLGLSTSCLNFDLANACLGFVNGMQLAATMIDAGQIDYALIVDGEGSRRTQEGTIRRLQSPTTTRQDVLDNFATLTLGSGERPWFWAEHPSTPKAIDSWEASHEQRLSTTSSASAISIA